jgi:hypothetical protein
VKKTIKSVSVPVVLGFSSHDLLHPSLPEQENQSIGQSSQPHTHRYDNLQWTSSVHPHSGIVRNFFILSAAIRTTTDTPLKFLTKNSRSKQTTKKSTATHTFTGNRPQLWECGCSHKQVGVAARRSCYCLRHSGGEAYVVDSYDMSCATSLSQSGNPNVTIIETASTVSTDQFNSTTNCVCHEPSKQQQASQQEECGYLRE